MAERDKESNKNRGPDNNENLSAESEKRKESIRVNLEKAEKEHRERISEAKVLAEATELAKEADEDRAESQRPEPTEQLRRAPSKKQRRESFITQMKELRNEMSFGSRIVSIVMHNDAVERISDIASSTVARPNAMLSGSIAAFISITVLYFIARYYGYHLSGFETVFAFALGWIVGIVYDYLKVLLGNREK